MAINSLIETIFGLGLFVNAALFIPQILQLARTKNAEGPSLITFIGFNIIQLFTVLHAYLHHDSILMIGNILSLITCGLVSVLIILFRRHATK